MARTEYGPRAEAIGTGILDTYTFDFAIKSLKHLIVGVVTDTFVKTFEVRGDDTTYLRSVAFTDGGGQVVLVTPLPTGHKIYILLADDAPLQESQFKNKGDFTLSLFTSALDALSGQIQRLNYQVKRSLKIGDQMVQAEADAFDTEIPFNTTNNVVQNNADKVVCVGADNKSFKMGPSVVSLAAQAAAAAASAAAAAVSQGASAASAAAAAASAATAALIAAKNTVYNGNGAPSNALGEDDSFYINNITKDMYGPKAGGIWPAPFALIGPQGPTGATGTAGASGLFSSIAVVGATPNASGVSNVSGAFTLQPADSTNPGFLSAGAQAIGGVKSFVDYIRRSAVSGLTAFAGGGQASATQLAKDINRVTTVATINDSVKLPAAVAGSEIIVINKGVAALNVYPATGESINALAANAAYSISSLSNSRFICAVTGIWDVASGNGGALRAANEAIGNAASSVTVVFSSATVNTSYVPEFSFINTTDPTPIFLQGIVTGKTTSGFTVTFNTPTDSANYVLGYQVNDAV